MTAEIGAGTGIVPFWLRVLPQNGNSIVDVQEKAFAELRR
jgi:hypothetical protein